MLVDADLFEQALGARAAFPLRDHVHEIHRQQHVLENRKSRDELKELEHDTDVLSAPARQVALVKRV